MPCYDFIPIIELRLTEQNSVLPTPDFFDVTGGEYKIRERIQRDIADSRLLAIPTSWSRVADSNLNWGAF